MILILMYHRIDDPDSPDRFNRFCAHIEWLCQQGEIILPGENPNPGQMGFCLTFDDAYVDYPHKVFPFLRDKGIPSVLGIPTGLIEERTSAPYRERLIQSVQPLEQECRVPTPLSTWEELRTLAKDPLIRLAAHGHQHRSLRSLQQKDEKDEELRRPQEIMAEKAGVHPDTFIYPYGHFDKESKESAFQKYRYVMRIGAALNRNWGTPGQLLYRVDADRYWLSGKGFRHSDRLRWTLANLINRARGR